MQPAKSNVFFAFALEIVVLCTHINTGYDV